jgi:hypothetical protein
MSPLATLTRKEFEKSIEAFAMKASKVAPQDDWHLQTHPAVSIRTKLPVNPTLVFPSLILSIP